MSRVLRFIILFALIANCAALFPSQERSADFKETTVNGSLAELRDKHRVWLIVRRSALLDARGAEESVLSEIYKGDNAWQNYPRTYNLIAKKLNKYLKEHGSLTAARSLSQSEFIVYFSVFEIRRPLGTPYAYGELFVILNDASNPRVLWKTTGKGMFADDAVDTMLTELKAARGER